MSRELFDSFVSEENLLAACSRVVHKGAVGGVDGISIDEFRDQPLQKIRKLRSELLNSSYLPEPTAGISIPKYDETQSFRKLSLPTVLDKIVQTAMLQVVEPMADKKFVNTSYGYRKGKGHYKAIRRVMHNLHNCHLFWVVQQDIDNFFDSLDHDRLFALFDELTGYDERLLELIILWCRNGIVDKNGRWQDVSAGVRQGQVIAPLLANLYLHDLDLFAADHCQGWIRYADDYIIMCPDRNSALLVDEKVKEFIQSELQLVLNDNQQGIVHLNQEFSFLGVQFQEKGSRISVKKISQMKRKIAWLLSRNNRSSLEKIFGQLQEMLQGWQRYYGFLDPKEQIEELSEYLEKSLKDLVRYKTTNGEWPTTPPGSITLPTFLHAGVNRKGIRALRTLWKEARISVGKADKPSRQKIDRRKRQYRKKEIIDGDLVVMTPGLFIGKRGERLVVRRKQTIILEILLIRMRSLTVANRGVSLSSDVIMACHAQKIPLYFEDSRGDVKAMLQFPENGSQELPLLQLKKRDSSTGLHLARMFLVGKLKNQRALLKYFGKYKTVSRVTFQQALEQALPQMDSIIATLREITDRSDPQFRQRIMGLEGAFAALYWRLTGILLSPKCTFPGRIHHQAVDPLNCFFNYGYGILYRYVHNALIRAGLNPAISFLHTMRSGKPVLCWDMVEEFRAPVVDRAIISMVNRGCIPECDENGSIGNSQRKKISRCILERLGSQDGKQGAGNTLVTVIQQQAAAVAASLKGKIPYRPFLLKW